MSDVIILQNGVQIKACQSKLARFCQKDASYKTFDLPADVRQDNELAEKDIRFANYMGARMGPRIIKAVLDRSNAINLALARIAPVITILDVSVPWTALEQLFSVTLGPEVGPARATKILHKKRPALIPILDSVVVSYCEGACGADLRGQDTASKMTAYVKVIKKDIDRNLDILESAIRETCLKLTPVRAFDILLWAYSGEYQRTFGTSPVWQRQA